MVFALSIYKILEERLSGSLKIKFMKVLRMK